MDFNNLDPNEKLALILLNRKNIARMRDDIIAIIIMIAVFGVAIVGIFLVLYDIKTSMGINIFP